MDWSTLTVLHAVPTLLMVGVIWVVQRVHYPSFQFADGERFAAFEQFHCARIGPVVMPLMLAELTCSALLPWQADGALQRALAWTGAALLGAVWASTFLIQVPLHARLQAGWDAAAARRLVATNWWRTAAWTLRGGVAVWMLLATR